MTLQMLLISSVYPLKPALHTSSLMAFNTAIKKGKKEGQCTVGTQEHRTGPLFLGNWRQMHHRIAFIS